MPTSATRARVSADFYAGQVAELVKLLDLRDAASLIAAFHNFPDDVVKDLSAIERALREKAYDKISELLRWYGDRNLARMAGVPEEKCMLPKKELHIFK